MKRFTLIALMCITLTTMNTHAQENTSGDYASIETTIRGFLKAGDQNNADQLATYIDNNYRVVMNQLFGSTDIMVVSKEMYVAKIASKEWGGDTREVTIKNIQVNGNTASAHVISAGTKATFISTMVLVKNNAGSWKLISDIPIVE